jgi:hypothetical protein
MYRKTGRQLQEYRVRWKDGSLSQVLHEHLELVSAPGGQDMLWGGADIHEDTDYNRFICHC